MFRKLLIFAIVLLPFTSHAQVYEVSKGMIRFYSEAPQELIRASTNELKGALNVKKKTFAFKVSIVSFMGFNSPLQREHFNENYMETVVFPEASFTGKIIEDTDITKDGEHTIRAKGKLKIHGVEQERIIEVEIHTKGGKMIVHSEFLVALSDHNIKIPRVVYDKLAPDIHVTVGASMLPDGKQK